MTKTTTSADKPPAKDPRFIREKEIQDYLLRRLKTMTPAPYVVKTMQTNHRGTPDVLVCYKGDFIAIECKRPVGGRLSALQRITLNKIEDAGGVVATVSTFEEVDALIQDLQG